MADANKSKLQLRTGLSINGDKTPSPATKLLINHGKPNFTIQRSHKTQNGNVKPTSPTPTPVSQAQNNNNEFVVKSTTFNGVFKPSNISAAAKQTLPQNGHAVISDDTENEVAKVVLRRRKFEITEIKNDKDDNNVPEFIRRQRRIQERLANQNILDFENRRSGYFTQVLISPSSPSRQSFMETMASPAVKPGLEIPPPSVPQCEDVKEETTAKEEEQQYEPQQEQQPEVENNKKSIIGEPVSLNGQVEEEEVAKAIEEVNKAVEGEDDDKTELEENVESSKQAEVEQDIEPCFVAVIPIEHTEDIKMANGETPQETTFEKAVTDEKLTAQQNGHPEDEKIETAALADDKIESPDSNRLVEETSLQNGHSHEKILDNEITISHTNGLNGPRIPTPDPKNEKGVNFEPKTVISFSQELGTGDNKYPDTIKVLKDAETTKDDSEIKDLAKLKFEIKANEQDIEVKPVLTTKTD